MNAEKVLIGPDWVRQEIAAALKDRTKTIVPILVKGARIPPPAVLPTDIVAITTRETIELRGDYWDHDVRLLTEQIRPDDRLPRQPASTGPDPLNGTRPCRPIHVAFELNPNATQRILLTLDKTCDDNSIATWKMTFELQEGNPLDTVVRLEVEIDPEDHPKAEATAAAMGLDDNQQGQAKFAAAVAKDPTATVEDKKDAAQQVIAARQA